MPCQSHTPSVHHPNNISPEIQIMNILCMQVSPASCYFKYSPQHPVLKHPKSVIFSYAQKRVLRPYKTRGKVTVLYILFFTLYTTDEKTKRSKLNGSKHFPNFNCSYFFYDSHSRLFIYRNAM
jgi:hypothetical protein